MTWCQNSKWGVPVNAEMPAATTTAWKVGDGLHSPNSTMFPMISEPSWHLTDGYWKRLIQLIDMSRQSGASGKPIGTVLFDFTTSSVFESEDKSSSHEFFLGTVKFMEIASSQNADLQDTLLDLDRVTAEAREEGLPIPSDLALANARRLLLAIYRLSPQRFEVYPTPDGEVAIDAPGGQGRSVLLLCDSDGTALCLVNMNGRHRRARYSDTNLLPDGFVREALDELARRDELAA